MNTAFTLIKRAPAGLERPHLTTCSCDTCYQRRAAGQLRATVTLSLAGVAVGAVLATIHDLATAGPGFFAMVGL